MSQIPFSRIVVFSSIIVGSLLGLVLLLEFSPEIISFEPEEARNDESDIDLITAQLFNPYTLDNGSLYVKKLNQTIDSPAIFCHNDRIEFCIGLRSKDGIPIEGIAFTLKMNVLLSKYLPIKEIILIEETNKLFITNSTGIARTELNYDQETWRGVDGIFIAESSEIVDQTAISSVFRLNYLKISLNRNTNSTNGLNILNEVENSNLLEKGAFIASPEENDYLAILNGSKTWPWEFESILINTSTINSLQNLIKPSNSAYYQRFIYIGWTLSLSKTNLTFNDIETIWKTVFNQKMDHYYFQLSSGSLSAVNIIEGWLILQKMKWARVTGNLGGDFISTKQIVILDNLGQIVWLFSDSAHTVM
ncbi:MAG: hypothetical protein ACFFDT_20150 [Candidatus Hodarchaeota archaeon]